MEKLNVDVSATGLVTTSYLDDEGKLYVDYKQDASADFELVQGIRKDEDHWRRGVKQNMVHAFHIPDGVIHELLKIGVNVYTSPLKDIVSGLKKIDRYSACDMTGKRLA